MPAASAKLVLDVTDEGSRSEVHPGLEHVARALNLYALAGVREDQVAVVVHGKATPLVLDDQAYRSHFGQSNPNTELLRELHSHGVQVLLCGQSMRHNGCLADEVAGSVEVRLSAMTALATLQQQGYALVP